MRGWGLKFHHWSTETKKSKSQKIVKKMFLHSTWPAFQYKLMVGAWYKRLQYKILILSARSYFSSPHTNNWSWSDFPPKMAGCLWSAFLSDARGRVQPCGLEEPREIEQSRGIKQSRATRVYAGRKVARNKGLRMPKNNEIWKVTAHPTCWDRTNIFCSMSAGISTPTPSGIPYITKKTLCPPHNILLKQHDSNPKANVQQGFVPKPLRKLFCGVAPWGLAGPLEVSSFSSTRTVRILLDIMTGGVGWTPSAGLRPTHCKTSRQICVNIVKMSRRLRA